jgi:hypothetical protein
MSVRKVLPVVLTLTALAGVPARAQQQPAPAPPAAAATTTGAAAAVPEGRVPHYIHPETPQQRQQRLGTVEDPGTNPDPNALWSRFGHQFKIQRFDKKWSRAVPQPGWIRPLGNVNFVEEIYQENEKYVWVWIEEAEDDNPAATAAEEAKGQAGTKQVSETAVKYYRDFRNDFTPLDPPKSNVVAKFEESSQGLPTGGSWRNTPAVADMNEDGNPDIILPPQRGEAASPAIFLGDGKGNWQHWDIKWPRRFNYGAVVAADFNKDKHLDLAFAVHLTGIVVFLGDGKGNFREVTQGLPTNFPTRRILATDVDHDGWLDIVGISEGPIGRGATISSDLGRLRAYLNRNKGESWQSEVISQRQDPLGGDWLASGNFNGDKYPDFAGSSVYFNSVHTIYLSDSVNKWTMADDRGVLIPYRSYYYGVTAGHFSSRDRDDIVVGYFRQWPNNLDPAQIPAPALDNVVGLDRISWTGGTPKRTSIIRWKGTIVSGVGHGDFNGDGNEDVIFTRNEPREAVLLLGDGKGNFKQATIEGLALSLLRNYDLTVADVNRDGRPDVIVMYESDSRTALAPKNGKVQVFLNRGTTSR